MNRLWTKKQEAEIRLLRVFLSILQFRFDQTVCAAFSLIYYIHFLCLCIEEYEEIMSQKLHLYAGILRVHGFHIKMLGPNNFHLIQGIS